MCFKCVFTVFVLLFLVYPSSAWVSGYDHRMPIEINNTGDVLINWQYNFTMDTAAEIASGNMTSSNGSDCCIADSSDVLQNFWNETAFNLSDTKIWVNGSSLDNVSNTTHYIYYGKSGAISKINGATTFEFFDDFDEWDQPTVERYGNNPILEPNASYFYEAKAVREPCVIYDPGAPSSEKYKMWYNGMNDTSGYALVISYATSSDGINWTKYAGNPVFQGTGIDTDFDNASVGGPFVIKEGSTYHMWYGGRQTLGLTWPHKCGYANSTDGINWIRGSSNPILSPPAGADEDAFYGPSVLNDSGTWKMWYVAYKAGTAYDQHIYYATSSYADHGWSNYSNSPIISPPVGWAEICEPEVIKLGSTYYMILPAWQSCAHIFRVYYLTSTNCINWSDTPGTLIIDSGGAGWEHDIHFPGVVIVNTSEKIISNSSADVIIYYSGMPSYNDFNTFKIGAYIYDDFPNGYINDKWTSNTAEGSISVSDSIITLNGGSTASGGHNTIKSGLTFPINTIAEFKINMTVASADWAWKDSGFTAIDITTAGHFATDPSTFYNQEGTPYIWSQNGGGDSSTATTEITTEHIESIVRNSTTNVQLWRDYSHIITHSTNIPTGSINLAVGAGNNAGANAVEVDWARVRKYTYLEPIVSLGPEESAPAVSTETITIVIL